ncbi:MAG: hypothetical protein EOO71_04245 [Myxococcaceae bacterium]|nr:MAG: hypothetical protein EOO71_04245 [Myxococcaceae bacterium]
MLTLGVDTRGQSLVLAIGELSEGEAPVEALWVDASGQPGTPFLALTRKDPYPYYYYPLLPLADGGLVLKYQDTWLAAFDSLQASTAPLPEWLSDERDFELLPGGKGYIRWSRVHAPDCQHEAELIAPSGRSCGTVRLPAMANGESCGSPRLSGNGTVIEQLSSEDPTGDSYSWSTCRIRWCPGLFQ